MIRPMKGALVVLVLLCAGAADADDITGITITPATIVVGHDAFCTASYTGNPVAFGWDTRPVGGGWPPSKVYTGSSITSNNPRQGQYEVRCTGTYAGYPPRYSPFSVTMSVFGPDTDTPEGLGTGGNGWPTMAVILKFTPKYQDIAIGYMTDGYPMARLDGGDWYIPGSDYGWGSDGKIWARFTYTPPDQTAWEQLPVGTQLDTFYWQNGMMIHDGFNQYQPHEFANRHYARVKSGSQSFKIVIIP